MILKLEGSHFSDCFFCPQAFYEVFDVHCMGWKEYDGGLQKGKRKKTSSVCLVNLRRKERSERAAEIRTDVDLSNMQCKSKDIMTLTRE